MVDIFVVLMLLAIGIKLFLDIKKENKLTQQDESNISNSSKKQN